MVMPSSEHVDLSLFWHREKVMVRWTLGLLVIFVIASAVLIWSAVDAPTLPKIVAIPIVASAWVLAVRILLSWTLAALPLKARGQSWTRVKFYMVANAAVFIWSVAAFFLMDGPLGLKVFTAILIGVLGPILLSLAFKLIDYLTAAVRVRAATPADRHA